MSAGPEMYECEAVLWGDGECGRCQSCRALQGLLPDEAAWSVFEFFVNSAAGGRR